MLLIENQSSLTPLIYSIDLLAEGASRLTDGLDRELMTCAIFRAGQRVGKALLGIAGGHDRRSALALPLQICGNGP